MIEQKHISVNEDKIINDLLSDGWTIKMATSISLILEREKANEVPDISANELLSPVSTFDEISDDEILYWSTPHYDELQAKKEERKQQLKDELATRGERHG